MLVFSEKNQKRYIIDVCIGDYLSPRIIGSMTREPGETSQDVKDRLLKDYRLIIRDRTPSQILPGLTTTKDVVDRVQFRNPYHLTGKPKQN